MQQKEQLGWVGKLYYRNIFFLWVGEYPENLFGIQFLCQGTHGMFCRILFISQLLMYICNEECQDKISPIQSYFNNFQHFLQQVVLYFSSEIVQENETVQKMTMFHSVIQLHLIRFAV